MSGLTGLVLVFATVFGGYLLAGGTLGVILYSLPFELMIIAGAAVGALIIANSFTGVKQTAKDLARAFTGPRWTPQDHRDLLCLLFQLLRIHRTKPMELDAHIEDPSASPIFTAYPRIFAEGEVVSIICDTMRSMTLNYNDPHQVEATLEKRIEVHHGEAERPARALQVMADGLPALGIVAAVLGVIKTMASIDQPPAVLGRMIAGALVGTFLGVFLAYGVVAPLAARLRAVINEEHAFYMVLRDVLVASLQGHAPNICVEVGRQCVPSHLRPSFIELDAALRNVRQGPATVQPLALAA